MRYMESMSPPINPDHVRLIHQKQKPQKMSPLLVIAKRVLREALSEHWLIFMILIFVSCLGIEQDCVLKNTTQKNSQKRMYPLAHL